MDFNGLLMAAPCCTQRKRQNDNDLGPVPCGSAVQLGANKVLALSRRFCRARLEALDASRADPTDPTNPTEIWWSLTICAGSDYVSVVSVVSPVCVCVCHFLASSKVVMWSCVIPPGICSVSGTSTELLRSIVTLHALLKVRFQRN